ncbi:hypothetical protein V1499_03175 [Neobacillus sp. SCS-31]|uniref:hypothetical protein n=1 Tax=Neobacillus oceani TaxID=3115292 RepID=UPI003906C2D9
MGRNFSSRRNERRRDFFEEEFDFDSVAGIFEEENFRRPVRNRAFCRAVRRCLINDLLAAEEDNRRRRRRHRCRS